MIQIFFLRYFGWVKGFTQVLLANRFFRTHKLLPQSYPFHCIVPKVVGCLA